MMDFNILDIVILGVTGISAIIGLFRGMIKETITLITWVVACIVALNYGDEVGNLFGNIGTELGRYVIGGFFLFISVLIFGGIINVIVNKFVTVGRFVFIDKLFGSLFGVARSFLVIVIAFPLVSELYEQKTWWRTSVLIPELHSLVDYSTPYFEDIKANIPEKWINNYSRLSSPGVTR